MPGNLHVFSIKTIDTPKEHNKLSNTDKLDALMSALATLCQAEPYEKISVGDIAKEAGIARQTFYAYAPSKDELLLSIIDDVFEEFFEKVSPVIINMDEIYRISL